MNRMRFASFEQPCYAISLIALTACVGSNPDMTEDEIVAKATEIHRDLLTIDTHDDIPPNFASEEVDPGVRGDRQVDIPKMIEGGLDAGFFIVFVGQGARTPEGYEQAKKDAVAKFEAIHRMAEDMYPEKIEIAYSADDVERINRSGKLVAAIGIENGYVIGKDLSLLEQYHARGARYVTLTHGGHNDIGDSGTPSEQLGDSEEEHGGLSDFGEQVVAEMNRLGIMVDVSHTSKKTTLDAIRVSRAPVIASHSATKAIREHPRNLDDEALMALKENGGVIQVVALESFVKEDPAEKTEAVNALREEMGITGYDAWRALSDEQRDEYRRRRDELNERWPRVNLQDVADHIDHAVQLIGIDHVGISSDFDGGGGVEGWDDASETLNVTIELVRRGYSEEDIAKLWGGNLLRVWREVERVAAELQSGATN